MKLERLLLNENTKNAQLRIDGMNQTSDRMNRLINAFNKLEALEPINDRETLLAMAENPKHWFDSQILEQLGGGLTAKVKPNLDQLAKMYNVPYSETLADLEMLSRLPYTICHFEDGVFSVSDEQKTEAFENAKEYTETDEQVRAFNSAFNLCRVLDTYCSKMNISDRDMYQIAGFLGLKHTDEFKVDFSTIRSKLNYPTISQMWQK